MIIKCPHCKREFDTPKQRNQHRKDAHPNWKQLKNESYRAAAKAAKGTA